jgi:hypothetical protein
LDVQYKKNTLPVVQYGKNNVRSHVLNGVFDWIKIIAV